MKLFRKTKLLISLILGVGASITSHVSAQELLGVMRCKIVDQGVRAIADGLVESYSKPPAFGKSPKRGEWVILAYGFTEDDRFRFHIEFRGERVFYTISPDVETIDPNTATLQNSDDIFVDIRKENQYWYQLTDRYSPYNEIWWSSEGIKVDGLMGELELQRYYKSDWHGLFITRLLDPNHLGFAFAFLDCRHNTNRISKITHYLADNVD